MFLSKPNFAEIVRNTPLVSIDLCILKGRKILLGKRLNPPAENFFFVPGGRIYKSELKKDSLKRILRDELGFTLKTNHEEFIRDLGSYEHFYNNNFMNNKNFGTHYVVLAFLIPYKYLIKNINQKIHEQHSEYIWVDLENIKDNDLNIHQYTLQYFKNPILQNFKENN